MTPAGPLLFVRFAINGLAATICHYLALHFQLEVLGVQSAGLANLYAAALGIGVSFVGNRLFVFRMQDKLIGRQVGKFLLVYGLLAVYHAFFLYLWTDSLGFDYRVGFLLCTMIQLVLSFVFNRIFVFRTAPAHAARQSNHRAHL